MPDTGVSHEDHTGTGITQAQRSHRHRDHTGSPLLGLCYHGAREDQRMQAWMSRKEVGLTQVWLELDYSAQKEDLEEKEIKETKYSPSPICSHVRHCHLHLQRYSCCTDNPTPHSEVCVCVWILSEWEWCYYCKNNCFSSLKTIFGKPHVIVVKSLIAPGWTVTHQHAAAPQHNRCHQQQQ